MSTKIVYVGVKPAESTGADVASYGPHSPGTIDQNFANLQAAVDRRLLSSDAVVGGGASKVPLCDASGNLLMGVASGSQHIFKKDITGDYALVIDNPSSSNPFGLHVIFSGKSTAGTGYYFVGGDASGSKILVAHNGNVTNTNNSYGATSDIKLKENVVTARSYLPDLCAVRVVRYSLISEASTTPTHLGVIAQELEQVFPGLVEDTPDMAERQKVVEGVPQSDEDGAPVMEHYSLGTTTKSVKYSVFVPMLITAVQELKLKNDALEARIAALEA